MRKLQSGDPVIVIAGKHKGKVSSIEKVVEQTRRDGSKRLMVIVNDVNVVKKAVKGQGFVEKTLPIDASNVMYYLEKDQKATRVAVEIGKDGKKSRMSVVGKTTIG